MWNNLTVKGFQFDNSADYAEAKREAEAIDYIASKMNLNDPQIALKVYYKFLERNNFHTVVGISFLKQLRDFCVESELVNDEQIKSINITDKTQIKGKIDSYGDESALETDNLISESQNQVDSEFNNYDQTASSEISEVERDLKKSIQNHLAREKKLKTVAEHYRSKMRTCYLVIAALVVVVIALFAISIHRGNLPYNDLESEIQNKYAAWAEELTDWEASLKEREITMTISPED